MRIRPNCAFERELWGRGVTAVAGVDEVGVGAFAGPVVAAAVILAQGTTIDGLADSKLLSSKRREDLFAVISGCALAIGIGRTEVEEVDRLNIYWAAMEARRRAVEALPTTPAHILVNGKRRIAGCRVSQTAVVDGVPLPLHRWSFAPVWRAGGPQPQLALWGGQQQSGDGLAVQSRL